MDISSIVTVVGSVGFRLSRVVVWRGLSPRRLVILMI